MGLFRFSKKKENEFTNNDILIDDYSDTPEGVWAKCHDCDTLMDYSQQLERFRCGCCGKEIAEEDYMEESDDSIPFVCRTCGGPYPQCMTSCKMFDD
jgi:hypothetical protein